MKKYDVIIIGAGPAGIAAAKTLKKAGINFCIIEKNKFPREKLCGGGLTHKSINLINYLNISIENINTKKCKEVRIVSNKISKKTKLYNEIIMVDRKEFDYNNVKQTTKNNLFEKENVINIKEHILITDKNEYEFKYIIFADGVNGYSRKMITNRKFGFCVEYNSDSIFDETIFDFSAIKDGYGWIFPKNDHTTIGVGKFVNKNDEYLNYLYIFAKKYNLKIDKAKIRGYHIPLYSKKVFKNSVIDDKFILVGDAASLVDRVSGEGIYYDLLSGIKAAESIEFCLKNNCNLKNIYFKKTKKLYSSLNKRCFLSKLLYSRYGEFFIKLGLSNKYFIKKINDIFG